MGQIGTSIGLALAPQAGKIRRIGLDKDPSVAQKAKSMGALDAVSYNLPSMVAESQVVLLCLPFDEVESTLEVMAADLAENAVVLDFSPVKMPVAAWFQKYVAANRHFVAMTPVINPVYLRDEPIGIDAARADLFAKTVMGIAVPAGTAEGALALATDLCSLLGASPLFIDLAEADGLMATVHLVPQLVSSSLLNATVDQSGWREARKLAGRSYHAATSGEFDYPGALAQAALQNRENTVRALDVVLATLKGLRDSIDSGDAEGLSARLEASLKAREKWLKERQNASWLSDEIAPSQAAGVGNMFQRLFGVGGLDKKKK
jgi:prephenate dehydrogenase